MLDGVPCNMTPAPSRQHQRVLGKLFRQIDEFLEGKECEAYLAPFDVRLADPEQSDEDVHTVVQPDLLVVCDQEKLDDQGCVGAPDFIIEILSPATAARDQVDKAELYEKSGVKEYWTVHPVDQVIQIQRQGPDGMFAGWLIHKGRETIEVSVLPGLHIDFRRVFETSVEEEEP